jgi:calcium-dependent protein kinase
MGSACMRRSNLKIVTIKTNSKKSLSELSKNSDFREKYEYIGLLGNGAFGKVRLFCDKNCSDLKYAIKTIKKEQMSKELYCFLIDEVNIISELDHPNIVKYYESYEDDNYLNIVMEYLEGNDLFKLISSRKSNKFTEKDMAEIITNLFKALSYIHKNIVHRDIKPENILFSDDESLGTLKIIDFGLSTGLKSDNKYRVGSPYYMAPEIINGNFCCKTDVWSVGVILYVMLTGNFPFHAKKYEEVFEKILNKPFEIKHLKNSKCSLQAIDLISKLLIKNTEERFSIEEALSHDWFSYCKDNREILHNGFDEEIINSLKSFAIKNLFQKEVMFYIAKLSKEEEIQKLKNVFINLDTNNTGTLDIVEIKKGFNILGIKIENVKIFKKKIFKTK